VTAFAFVFFFCTQPTSRDFPAQIEEFLVEEFLVDKQGGSAR